MRVNCEVRALAGQPKPRINDLRNRGRLKNRCPEQKSVADHAGEDDRGELAMFGGRRSWFEPDFFKQRRESWVGTQFIQTGADAVFPQIRNATVFVFHASGEASKGFIMIA
jgi:hypothetical protein